jgi:hypothetical protein
MKNTCEMSLLPFETIQPMLKEQQTLTMSMKLEALKVSRPTVRALTQILKLALERSSLEPSNLFFFVPIIRTQTIQENKKHFYFLHVEYQIPMYIETLFLH